MKKPILLLASINVVYSILSVLVFLLTGDGLHIMLAWNVFLATIPCFLTVWLTRIGPDFLKAAIPVFLLWLLFLPNSFYVVTDLIYLDQDAFYASGYPYQPGVYLMDVLSYLGYFHILLGAILGVAFFVFSLVNVKKCILGSWFGRYSWLGIMAVCFLSATGIYIGRFHRFNSWDILDVFGIIKAFVDGFSWFSVFFVLGFFILQFAVYLVFVTLSGMMEVKKNVSGREG